MFYFSLYIFFCFVEAIFYLHSNIQMNRMILVWNIVDFRLKKNSRRNFSKFEYRFNGGSFKECKNSQACVLITSRTLCVLYMLSEFDVNVNGNVETKNQGIFSKRAIATQSNQIIEYSRTCGQINRLWNVNCETKWVNENYVHIIRFTFRLNDYSCSQLFNIYLRFHTKEKEKVGFFLHQFIQSSSFFCVFMYIWMEYVRIRRNKLTRLIFI